MKSKFVATLLLTAIISSLVPASAMAEETLVSDFYLEAVLDDPATESGQEPAFSAFVPSGRVIIAQQFVAGIGFCQPTIAAVHTQTML